jgi:hypothetical protein
MSPSERLFGLDLHNRFLNVDLFFTQPSPALPSTPSPTVHELVCDAFTGLLRQALAHPEFHTGLLRVLALILKHPQAAREMVANGRGGGPGAGSQDVNMDGASSQYPEDRSPSIPLVRPSTVSLTTTTPSSGGVFGTNYLSKVPGVEVFKTSTHLSTCIAEFVIPHSQADLQRRNCHLSGFGIHTFLPPGLAVLHASCYLWKERSWRAWMSGTSGTPTQAAGACESIELVFPADRLAMRT